MGRHNLYLWLSFRSAATPLYRQERIFGRAGVEIPRSTLAQWVGICGVRLQPLVDALKGEILKHSVLHADETPVAMLKPGTGKTHRAYLWAYAPGAFEDLRAVIYDFCETRAGEHARAFLGEWKGCLVCDDYAGYKAGFVSGITEAGCMAHSRRKFFAHGRNRKIIKHQQIKLGQLGEAPGKAAVISGAAGSMEILRPADVLVQGQ